MVTMMMTMTMTTMATPTTTPHAHGCTRTKIHGKLQVARREVLLATGARWSPCRVADVHALRHVDGNAAVARVDHVPPHADARLAVEVVAAREERLHGHTGSADDLLQSTAHVLQRRAARADALLVGHDRKLHAWRAGSSGRKYTSHITQQRNHTTSATAVTDVTDEAQEEATHTNAPFSWYDCRTVGTSGKSHRQSDAFCANLAPDFVSTRVPETRAHAHRVSTPRSRQQLPQSKDTRGICCNTRTVKIKSNDDGIG
jgi:hypothetical protein